MSEEVLAIIKKKNIDLIELKRRINAGFDCEVCCYGTKLTIREFHLIKEELEK